MPYRSVGASLVAAIAALTLAGCGGGHDAAASAARDPHAPYAVVVKVGANLASKHEIASLFVVWNAALQTGGPNDVAQLYAEDATLLPTGSNALRTNRVEIANFISDFQAMHPRGTINEQHIDVLDSTTAMNSGVYTFDIIKEGRPDFMVARYSFVYEKIGGKWLIKNHHSSEMPEVVISRPAPLAQVMAANTVAEAAVASPAVAAPEPAHH